MLLALLLVLLLLVLVWPLLPIEVRIVIHPEKGKGVVDEKSVERMDQKAFEFDQGIFLRNPYGMRMKRIACGELKPQFRIQVL